MCLPWLINTVNYVFVQWTFALFFFESLKYSVHSKIHNNEF